MIHISSEELLKSATAKITDCSTDPQDWNYCGEIYVPPKQMLCCRVWLNPLNLKVHRVTINKKSYALAHCGFCGTVYWWIVKP